jgi:FkbM family methyltransferase
VTVYGHDHNQLRTPRGVRAMLSARDDTADLSVIGSTFAGVAGSPLVDEYHLADLHITGRFVDVGAHIGSVTVAVLLDNPEATAICVEPIPENVEMLAENLALNGLTDRATILVGAVGTDHVFYQFSGTDHLVQNRYISNSSGYVFGEPQTSVRLDVRTVTIADLLPCEAIKLDCEGGEWALFKSKRLRTVPIIFGEYHGAPGDAGVRRALGSTHDVTFDHVSDAAGNFRAVRR